MRTIAREDMRAAVQALALSGAPLCVHSSLRSFGWVEGGAHTVVDALLAEDCTVLVPTFSWVYSVAAPPHLRPARNGSDYSADRSSQGAGKIFTPASTEVDQAEMGAVPSTVVSMPGRRRGNHPLNSFSAVGPSSGRLIDAQTSENVYGPLKALAELDGWVVLMGVGLTSMTLLHLAEERAGRTLFRRWANGSDGIVQMVATGCCSDGFDQFEPLLAPLAREVLVGSSRWRAFPAGPVVEVAATAIRADPLITHCGREECERCRDAVLGGPLLPPAR